MGYVAEGLTLSISSTAVKAAAVPIVAGAAFLLIKRVRRAVAAGTDQD